jgi:hypothetical protein
MSWVFWRQKFGGRAYRYHYGHHGLPLQCHNRECMDFKGGAEHDMGRSEFVGS